VKTSAVVNAKVASFMIAPFSCCIMANEVRHPCVPACPSQFVAVPMKVFTARKSGGAAMHLKGRNRRRHAAAQLKIVQLNLPRYQGH
jgi:hypothetical protein